MQRALWWQREEAGEVEATLSEEPLWPLVPGPSCKGQPSPERPGHRWVSFDEEGPWGWPRLEVLLREGLVLQEPLLSRHHHLP